MASNTENLNLLMKNPSTDGADTFNVQTMLNENWQKIDNNAGTVAQTLANILKPTTPPIIGLPPSTTPDGMFQALGNTGELHVWRKTVTTAQVIPAGYTLGTLETVTFKKGGTSTLGFRYGASIGVSDDGKTVYINNASTGSWYGDDIVSGSSVMKGKFIKLYSDSAISNLDTQPVYFFPQSSTMECDTMSGKIYANVQLVTGYPLTPAGTTTTYPVSTNPKAYQEGDDAKAAGYVVGEVETGKFALAMGASGDVNGYNVADNVTVDDNGNISLVNPTYSSLNGSTSSSVMSIAKTFIGKFLIMAKKGNGGDFPADTVWFIPTDANTGNSYNEGDDIYNCKNYVTKRQPVTGYAAIPAGTTIEYLGKLGDKARVQVVSYVGTGRSGADNPNSLTFDFVPKLLLIKSDAKSAYYICLTLFGTMLTGTYETYSFFDASGNMSYPDSSYARKNGKNIQWYSLRNAYVQANGSGLKYTAIAIG